MKKQKLTTKKLRLSKFKIASISNFGKRKILGGDGGGENTETIDKTSDSIIEKTIDGITQKA